MEDRAQDELEKLFRSNLDDIEVSPSEKVWKDIEARLDKKPRRRFLWWFFFLGISLVGGGSYSIYKLDILPGNSGNLSENISDKYIHPDTKATKVMDSPDSEFHNDAYKKKRNSKSDPDSVKSDSEIKKMSGENPVAISARQVRDHKEPIKTEKQNTNEKKKVTSNITLLKKETVPVAKNSGSLNNSKNNKPAGNSAYLNPVNTSPDTSSGNPSKKIFDTGKTISMDQTEDESKNKPEKTGGDEDPIKNHEEKLPNKEQAITGSITAADTIKPETKMEADIQPAGKELAGLKDQNSAAGADTNLIKPDSLNKKENVAVLANDTVMTNKKEKKLSKYSVAIFYSPDMNKPFLSDRSEENFNDPYHFRNISHPQNTFSEGLILGYDQTSRLRWQTGISYTELTQSTEAASFKYNWHDKLSFDFSNSFGNLSLNSSQFDKNDNSSSSPGDTIHIRYETKEKTGYLKLPLTCNYKITKGRFTLYTIASVSGVFLVKNQAEFHLLDAPSGKVLTSSLSGIRKINIGFTGGLGGQLFLFRGLYIFAEPNLKTSLFAINRRTSVKYIPFSLSISAGLGFHF
jgi:hypothetical protein